MDSNIYIYIYKHRKDLKKEFIKFVYISERAIKEII